MPVIDNELDQGVKPGLSGLLTNRVLWEHQTCSFIHTRRTCWAGMAFTLKQKSTSRPDTLVSSFQRDLRASVAVTWKTIKPCYIHKNNFEITTYSHLRRLALKFWKSHYVYYSNHYTLLLFHPSTVTNNQRFSKCVPRNLQRSPTNLVGTVDSQHLLPQVSILSFIFWVSSKHRP